MKATSNETIRKFDDRANDYSAARPCYSAELIEYMYKNYELSESTSIADIGSGTGKFSKHLLDKNSQVYCVEPNADMRSEAEQKLRQYKNFHSIAGTAENTTLKPRSVDCITVAQAFHWFDIPKFRDECLRISKKGAPIFLIWNMRDDADLLNREWHKIFSEYCPEFKGFSNGIGRDDPKIKDFFDGEYEHISFDHPLIFDKPGFIRRSLSSSYSLRENCKNFELYISALKELFDKYEHGGHISVSNRSLAYIGRLK